MKLLSDDYNKTTTFYLIISSIWVLLGVVIRLVNEFQMIAFVPGPDSYFSYGYLRPAGANLLIFGGLLGFFLALGFQIIQARASFKIDLAGLATLGAHQTALLLGVATIFLGYNTGREYGEMNWIADNLMMVVFTIFLVLFVIALWGKEDVKVYEKFAGATIGGMMVFYFLGNFGAPNGLLETTAPTSGAQDELVAETYRNAVLVFFYNVPPLYERVLLAGEAL
jgi:cytochrome c oxidase cbb3-type subunit 1